jgi:hypothetical protein
MTLPLEFVRILRSLSSVYALEDSLVFDTARGQNCDSLEHLSLVQKMTLSRKRGRGVLTIPLLLAVALPCFASDQALQYVGRWQVDRIMQPHKLPYYPRDCDTAKDTREIVATGDGGIEIRGGKKTDAYDVTVVNGKHFFESNRRSAVQWESAGDTFLHSVGVFWNAYRRCETPRPAKS